MHSPREWPGRGPLGPAGACSDPPGGQTPPRTVDRRDGVATATAARSGEPKTGRRSAWPSCRCSRSSHSGPAASGSACGAGPRLVGAGSPGTYRQLIKRPLQSAHRRAPMGYRTTHPASTREVSEAEEVKRPRGPRMGSRRLGLSRAGRRDPDQPRLARVDLQPILAHPGGIETRRVPPRGFQPRLSPSPELPLAQCQISFLAFDLPTTHPLGMSLPHQPNDDGPSFRLPGRAGARRDFLHDNIECYAFLSVLARVKAISR